MPYRPEHKKRRAPRKSAMLQYDLEPMKRPLTAAEQRAFKREGTEYSGPRDYLRRTIARVRGRGW